MYELYIANKNYSSWSLRAWVLMRELNIPFTEQLLPFGHTSSWQEFRKISPSGKVPCLVDVGASVWDSIAIVEYLAERHDAVWPADRIARAWARSAAAEMHSEFNELRRCCSMSCGMRIRLKEIAPGLKNDISRINALWTQGLHRFGGPYLAGQAFSAVDAFFAPVGFRIQTYGLTLEPASAAYAMRLLKLRSMGEWYADALKEKMRDESHDVDVLRMGAVLEDLREK
jgi:glutathione S-transferase